MREHARRAEEDLRYWSWRDDVDSAGEAARRGDHMAAAVGYRRAAFTCMTGLGGTWDARRSLARQAAVHAERAAGLPEPALAPPRRWRRGQVELETVCAVATVLLTLHWFAAAAIDLLMVTP